MTRPLSKKHKWALTLGVDLTSRLQATLFRQINNILLLQLEQTATCYSFLNHIPYGVLGFFVLIHAYEVDT